MTKKSDQATKLLAKVDLPWRIPKPVDGVNLLAQGMLAVLLRHVDEKKGRSGLSNLLSSYEDWNELRVAQVQEIAQCMKIGAKGQRAAVDVKTYLQEIFQQSHGLDLEFLGGDSQAAYRFVTQLPFLGLGTAHYLLWLAHDRALPVTSGLIRVLDRVGLISRTTSIKKAREAITPLIPAGDDAQVDFVVRVGEVASRWCEARKPLCHLCVLVDDCTFGKKAFKDWKVQQERLAVQRARETARLEAQRKKEEERAAREEARARKKAEAAEAKRQREIERKERVIEKKRAAEAAKKAAAAKKKEAEAKKKAAAKKKLEDARKLAAKQKAAAAAKKKAELARKKAAKKKTAKKKTKKKTTRKPSRKA